MQVAELFVNLGVKGAEKLKGSLEDTDKNLQQIGTDAMFGESKIRDMTVAVAALGASIEEISRRGAKHGMAAEMFKLYTGLDTRPAQELAHHLGISNEQSFQMVSNVQDALANIRAHGAGSSSFFGALGLSANALEGKNTYQALSLVQDAIKRHPGMDTSISNMIAKELGLSPDMIARMRLPGGLFPHLSKDQLITDKEATENTKTSLKWGQLERDLTVLESKLSGIFTDRLVTTLDDWAKAASKLVDWFEGKEDKSPGLKTGTGDLTATTGVAGGAGLVGAVLSALGLASAAVPTVAAASATADYLAYKQGGFKHWFSMMGLHPDFAGMKPGSLIPQTILNLTVNTSVPPAKETKQTHTTKQTSSWSGKKSQTVDAYIQGKRGGN